MILRFCSGSVTPASAPGMFRPHRRRPAECCSASGKIHDLIGFAFAHHAGIDEDAGELVAYCFVDQHGGHGAIDAAGKAADDFAPRLTCADLFADFLFRWCGKPSCSSRLPQPHILWTKLPSSFAPSGV